MKKQHVLSGLLFVAACGAVLGSFTTGREAGKPAPAVSTTITSGAGWMTNIGTASTQAKNQNRDMLVWFSGHGWNDASDAIRATLSDPKFMVRMSEQFVLVNMNFNNDGGKSFNSDPAATVWADRLNVDALPALVLLDSNGRPYTSIDVKSPQLESAIATSTGVRASRDEAFARASSLIGAGKAAALDAGLSTVRAFAKDWYEPELRALVDTNAPVANNWAPLLAETIINRAIQSEIYPLVDAAHYQKALDRIDILIAETRMSIAQRQLLIAFKAQLYCSLNDYPKARVLFDEALALDPNGPETERIRSAQAKIDEATAVN